MPEKNTRIEMVLSCQALDRSGLNRGASGNLSVRDGTDMLITPSAVAYDEIAPARHYHRVQSLDCQTVIRTRPNMTKLDVGIANIDSVHNKILNGRLFSGNTAYRITLRVEYRAVQPSKMILYKLLVKS